MTQSSEAAVIVLGVFFFVSTSCIYEVVGDPKCCRKQWKLKGIKSSTHPLCSLKACKKEKKVFHEIRLEGLIGFHRMTQLKPWAWTECLIIHFAKKVSSLHVPCLAGKHQAIRGYSTSHCSYPKLNCRLRKLTGPAAGTSKWQEKSFSVTDVLSLIPKLKQSEEPPCVSLTRSAEENQHVAEKQRIQKLRGPVIPSVWMGAMLVVWCES